MSDSSNVLCLKTEPKPYGVQVEWTWPDGSHWFSRVELQYVREKSIPVVKVIEWPVTGLFISGLKVGEKIHVRMRGLDKEGNGPRWKASDWIEGVASELQSTVDEVLDSIRKSDVFEVLSGETFINNTLLKGACHLTAASDQCLMEPLSEAARGRIRALNNTHLEGFNVGINPLSPSIKLSDEMRDAVITAVRESGQFVEKPTGDEQQSVEFRADRFKIQANVDAIVEAMNAARARQDAMMTELASAQAVLTERINQVVNDAITNALKPGGVLYAFRTRT
ncbi:MAG: hypothetical protein E7I22_01085 [Bifidobacterium longum]|nr:hypothetical protein [Bifidobacterium longum]